MSTPVSFHAKNGTAASGILVEAPPGAKAPCLVLVQEFWGINDHVRSIAERFAREGFLVVAPDLYHGEVAKTREEASRLMGALDWKLALDEIAGAVEYARARPRSNGKVAIAGFCLGGALSFAAATTVEGLAAVVPFYGVPKAPWNEWSRVRAPIQAHFSATDDWAKPELARDIEKAVLAQGKPMELYVYDAKHAFMNDARPEAYDAASAKLAWERTIAFLRKHMA
jgi:carboxymethylenebutenolidase